MKKRVLIIPENFPTDENRVAGIFIKDQIKALAPHCDISVFNSNPWYRGKYEVIEDVRDYDFHLFANKPPTLFKIPAYAWWEKQSLRMALKIPKPDVIHLHGASLRGKWVQKLARQWRIPYVITEHTGPWSAISNRPRVFSRAKAALENAAAVLPVSNHLKKEMQATGVKAKRWEILGNPVDTQLFTLRTTPLRETKNILFLGRLDAFKGAIRTLKAFHKAMEELPGYRLTLAGTGEEENAISNYIATHDLQSRVEFIHASLSREEMRHLFHSASFLVFPSEFESFGLVGAEAMATGLPLIVTNQTGPRDFTLEGLNTAVNPNSIEEMATAMVKTAEEIDRFSPEKIRSFIEDKFGIESYGNKLFEIYRELS